jgi:hypothetical protein
MYSGPLVFTQVMDFLPLKGKDGLKLLEVCNQVPQGSIFGHRSTNDGASKIN